MYNIVMFAYNEQNNIQSSINSVYQSKDKQLNRFVLIANGCTDNTVDVANKTKLQLNFSELEVVSLEVGDKCNAWNYYMHNLSSGADVHFFVDADVRFSKNCFNKMHDTLNAAPEETVAIAGLPLSGRNIEFYRSLVKNRSCFFGNLYGLRNSFINRIKQENFYLPKRLNWIDSFLTKAVNTDLQFFNYNLPNRVTHIDGVGYEFDSLSPFKLDDIKLYLSRIARYELGKLQEKHLDALGVKNWPQDLNEMNKQILDNFANETAGLSVVKKHLIKKRLRRLLKK